MTYEELQKKLKQLDTEDFIWLIYIGIIFLSWYSNSFERKYFLYNDKKSKETYRKLIILIFSILIVVYVYFLKDAFDDLRNLRPTDSYRKRKLVILSFIGSLLIAISGFIFLYIALVDEELNVELAFN